MSCRSDISDRAQRLRKQAWEKLRETKMVYGLAEERRDYVTMLKAKKWEGMLEIFLDLIDEIEEETIAEIEKETD